MTLRRSTLQLIWSTIPMDICRESPWTWKISFQNQEWTQSKSGSEEMWRNSYKDFMIWKSWLTISCRTRWSVRDKDLRILMTRQRLKCWNSKSSQKRNKRWQDSRRERNKSSSNDRRERVKSILSRTNKLHHQMSISDLWNLISFCKIINKR